MKTVADRIRDILKQHSTEGRPMTLPEIKTLLPASNPKLVSSGLSALISRENHGQLVKRKRDHGTRMWAYWYDHAAFKPPEFLLRTDKGDEHHTIPMILFCPSGHRHIDEGAFEHKAHHTHACQECGVVWRPAKVNTHGVHFLPGYKNEDPT